MIADLLCRLIGLSRVDRLCKRSEANRGGRSIFRAVLEDMGTTYEVTGEDRRRIPGEGPVIVVANHPTGGIEGVILPALLDTVRGDVKTMAHAWFERWPMLAERMILVDAESGGRGKGRDGKALRAAIRWVRRGGMLLLFPAGDVARFRVRERKIAEQPWRPGLAFLAKATGAAILPVHVSGRNSLLYQIISLMVPPFGKVLLIRELIAKRGKRITVRIGRAIPCDRLALLGSEEAVVSCCRREVERLGSRRAVEAGAPADRRTKPLNRSGLCGEMTRAGRNDELSPKRARRPHSPSLSASVSRPLRQTSGKGVRGFLSLREADAHVRPAPRDGEGRRGPARRPDSRDNPALLQRQLSGAPPVRRSGQAVRRMVQLCREKQDQRSFKVGMGEGRNALSG